MFNERAFITQIESASPENFARILARPSAQEEEMLRVYFGDARYQRLHSQALKQSISRTLGKPKGNVIIIHGAMGSELTAIKGSGDRDRIWINLFRIAGGHLEQLRLAEDGRTSESDVRATGILTRHYGELLLSLSQNWNIRAFWYDWRKDLNLAAAELEAQINGWFGEDAPIHIVAHSMGGLVVRTFMKKYPERWNAMWDKQSDEKGKSGGRLIMLGTPNHGTFVTVQVITGLDSIVKKLALLDFFHSASELVKIFNTFAGIYQLLPSPFILESMEPLYTSETYGNLNVPQHHLDNARKHHEWLRHAIDPERMVYIAGYNQPTISDIKDIANLRVDESYKVTRNGDGRVPHILGLLKTEDERKVKTYYVEEEHGNLPSNHEVLTILDELLETGTTQRLSEEPLASRGEQDEDKVREQLRRAQEADEKRLEAFVYRIRTRNKGLEPTSYITSEERKLEEILTRDLLGYEGEEIKRAEKPQIPFEPTSIEIGLVCGGIDRIEYENIKSLAGDPVDTISVGHYIGVKPQSAIRALDEAISLTLCGKEPKDLLESDLILTQYIQRNIIYGKLGQPFFLSDPRMQNRTIAIAGMDEPGRFGIPELTVLARELCWALGRMGKRHLATVLIGSGNGNLSLRDAISAWIRGIKYAITGASEEERKHLERITFVEIDPRKIGEIDKAVSEMKESLEKKNRLKIHYKNLNRNDLRKFRQEGLKWERREWEKRHEGSEKSNAAPTLMTLSLERDMYRFAAITEVAAIPEREIPLDPTLVMQANNELAAAWEPTQQFERGLFLERLLVPDDLRVHLSSEAPIVMLLDAATARIHWEMVAQSDRAGSERPGIDFETDFLGTSRGFTRQLRTTFAPPPEPPPPPRRIMRVLVIADPAEDARLPGAEEEGIEIADLFEAFNTVYKESENRVEVIRLFGPREATRTNVLRELTLRSYDVLHFAGHCVYDKLNPTASGWIFTGDKRLSANELNRIDRIPKFVFSNACESGITPDRSEKRSVELAPSFAEAFFARGVSNFVCTAWPVDDAAARQFAIKLYSGLLSLTRKENRYVQADMEPMHVAMRKARLEIATTPNGARTWGAYQHYGNPYFQFFDPTSMGQRRKGNKKG
jgi:pimeloyl-ACP methyl ester carboxylesterase